MTNAEIFLLPGKFALNFILSVLSTYPGAVDQGLYLMLAFMLALVTWCWAVKLCFVLIQRAFGFGRGGMR